MVDGTFQRDVSCEFVAGITKDFAAGPWQAGEPPKDGEWYFCLWAGDEPGVCMWSMKRKSFIDDNFYKFPNMPTHWAKINLPSAE